MLKALDWRDAFPIQSIIKIPSLSDLLDMDPLMIIGYVVVGASGIFAIAMAKIEKKLAKEDNERAEAIGVIAKAILMAAGIFGAVYYVIIKNPLWKFIR